MSDEGKTVREREAERNKKTAEERFKLAERRDSTAKAEIEKERAATAAKTKKLRALRLAHEAKERAAAKSIGSAVSGALEPLKALRRPTDRKKRR